MKILYKIVLLAILPFSLNATSLKEIMQITLKNNLNIKAMDFDIASKKETLKSVSNTLNPTLNIGASYNRLDLNVRSTQIGATTMGYVKFGADLYDGGKNNSIKRQKSFELKSSKLNTKEATRGILLQVVTIFFQIKTIDENLFAYQDKSKALNAQYKREQQKYDLKMITIDEVMKLRSVYESNNYIIDDLKYQRESLYQNLSLLAGKNITSIESSKLPDLKNLKYQSSSGIKSLQNSLKAADENIIQINSIKKPKIRVEDSVNIYHYSNYNKGLLKDLPNQQNQFMLNFSLNIFDTSSSTKKQSAVLAKLVKNEQLNYAKSKEKMIFTLAKKKLLTQKAKINSAKSALEMANSVYDIILTKFQNGIVDNIAYLDALSAKTINRALYAQALNNYEIAKANYYFSSGIDCKEVLKMQF